MQKENNYEDKYKHERLQYQANRLIESFVELERIKAKAARQYQEFTVICRQNQEQPHTYIENAKKHKGIGVELERR